MKSDKEVILKRISSQLETLIRLFILAAFREQNTTDKIIILDAAGISPSEIADILGTTRNTVNVTLSQHRKKRGKSNGNKSRSSKSAS